MLSSLALVLGNLADAASTYYVLTHGSNVKEGNPLLPQNPLTIVLIKSVITGLELLALSFTAHLLPLATNLTAYAVGAVGVGLAIHNLLQLKK